MIASESTCGMPCAAISRPPRNVSQLSGWSMYGEDVAARSVTSVPRNVIRSASSASQSPSQRRRARRAPTLVAMLDIAYRVDAVGPGVVATRATVDHVALAVERAERVVAGAAEHDVRSGSAVEIVIPGAADQRVVAAEPEDEVVSAEPADDI